MRLLLAEDESMLLEALEEMLVRNNYSVDAVADGQEALDYLEMGEYDGVVMDIMMPRLDGITVLKTIRERGDTTPVLLLTAKAEIDDRVLGLDSGADDYLIKPFAMKEFLARVRAITRRQPTLQNTVLTAGNLCLQRSDCLMKGPKGELHLANKEYQLMETLMMNLNNVISTERLMEKIWGYDSEAEINVVWVNISSLRKKCRELGANVEIKAACGIGYYLKVD